MSARVLAAPLKRPIAVSAAIHVLGFSILFALRPNGPTVVTPPATSVTLEASPEPVESPEEAADESAGSGAPRDVVAASRPAAPPTPTPSPADEKHADGDSPALGGVVGDVLGFGGLGGDGLGVGHGRGGAGAGHVLFRAPLPTSLKAPPSKARPARLIYPSRRRDVPSEQLFVVELHIDNRGYVTGVRLIRGQDPHSTEKALDAVWRFRYDPARNDAGEKIASVLEQEFHLNR